MTRNASMSPARGNSLRSRRSSRLVADEAHVTTACIAARAFRPPSPTTARIVAGVASSWTGVTAGRGTLSLSPLSGDGASRAGRAVTALEPFQLGDLRVDLRGQQRMVDVRGGITGVESEASVITTSMTSIGHCAHATANAVSPFSLNTSASSRHSSSFSAPVPELVTTSISSTSIVCRRSRAASMDAASSVSAAARRSTNVSASAAAVRAAASGRSSACAANSRRAHQAANARRAGGGRRSIALSSVARYAGNESIVMAGGCGDRRRSAALAPGGRR